MSQIKKRRVLISITLQEIVSNVPVYLIPKLFISIVERNTMPSRYISYISYVMSLCRLQFFLANQSGSNKKMHVFKQCIV